MKQYVIDELRIDDQRKIEAYLDAHLETSAMRGLFRIALPEELYTAKQARHHQCQPFYFAVELEDNRITYEMLVRSDSQIRCDCIAYADKRQCNWLIEQAEAMLKMLDVAV